MTDGDGRPLIDKQGRILGSINIIDAAVVVFIAILLVGGVWFVAASGDETDPDSESEADSELDPAVRYATLDLGTVSPQVASQVDTDDTVQASDGRLTVTDIHRMPTDDQSRVFVRVEIEGEPLESDDDRFVYGEEPLRIDRALTLSTERYELSGQIQSVGEDGTELERIDVETLLDVELSPSTLDSLAVGDEFVSGDETVGTIETIEAYGTGNPDRRQAQIGVVYRTVAPPDGGRPVFGSTTIREGGTVTFETAANEFAGDIQRVGTVDPRGEPATRELTVQATNVDAARAEQLEAGMSETIRGEPIATVTDVTVTPTPQVTADGTVIDSPTGRTVELTVEASVRETPSGPRFKNDPLRIGDAIVLELDTLTVEAEVTGQ